MGCNVRQQVLALAWLLSISSAALPAQRALGADSLSAKAAGCYLGPVQGSRLPDTLRLYRELFDGLGYHRTSSLKTNWAPRGDTGVPPIWEVIGPDSIEIELEPLPIIAIKYPQERLRLRWSPDSLFGMHQRYRLLSVPGRMPPVAVVDSANPVGWRRVSCTEWPNRTLPQEVPRAP